MSKALVMMTQKSFGCIGVINKSKKLIGIITDGDLRRHMKANIVDKTASQIMTKNPTIINKKVLVGEAINIMNTNSITSLFICE